MNAPARHAPIPYDSRVEQADPDEAKADAALRESMHGIQETTFRDYGHAVRSVHAKSLGLLEGELRVLRGLPEVLAQGLFARPATYPVVMRFSTNPGDVLDDSVSAPRGLAVKVIGVEGERLPGSEGQATQDFVMANAPAFGAPTPKAFAKNLKLVAATTDTGQAWKKGFSATLRGLEALVEASGHKSALLTSLGGQPLTHPLGDSFFTQAPLRYGDYVAKIAVVPVAPELRALTGKRVDVSGKPNGLREAVIDFFRDKGGEWELRVQLRTNPQSMPIEDASAVWPESESQYVPVARITVPPQPAWSEARAKQVDDGLAFSPWHGLAAHRPLGGINRARKDAYRMSADFRAARNSCPVREPRSRLDLSGAPAQIYGDPGREGRRAAASGMRGRESPDPWMDAAAGAAGGLVGGLIVSGVLLGQEAVTGKPSELVKLERRLAEDADRPHPAEQARASLAEQVAAHGGHLLMSAASGAAYGLVARDTPSPAGAGLAFGLGFYALAYGFLGPALKLTPKLSRSRPADILQHALLHAAFGVATGVVAERLSRRRYSGSH